MSKSFRVAALASAALLYAAPSFADFQDFTVDLGSITAGDTATFLALSGNPTTIVADKLNGGYNEVLTIDNFGNFNTNAYANMNAFFANEGVDQLLGTFAGTTYNIYAIFSSSGTTDGATFNGLAGSFQLWIDPLVNTVLTLGATGLDPVGVASSGDDYKIAFASSMSFATGNNDNPGSYKIIWDDFTLTSPEGSNFFIAPDDFYMNVEVTGDFDQFAAKFGGSVSGITGDVSAIFRSVPEPSSLALAGLALLSFGLSRRRKV